MSASVKKAAVIGGGVIGGGWVARLMTAGFDVAVFDPYTQAEKYINDVISRNEAAMLRLWPGQTTGQRGKITYAETIGEAVDGAMLVQESVPERLELKQTIHQEIGEAISDQAVIGSSTSGLLPSDIQKLMPHADRMMVAHPYNPVYLLPVVEIVGGEKTSQHAIDTAMQIYSDLGMKPVHITKEIDAFVGDRLLEAMWRESLWLVKEGVATAGTIDDIVRHGLGMRFAQMGQFMTYRLGGGEGGFRHFLEQFEPSLKWPWTKLMDVPEWTDDLVDSIVSQSDEHTGGLSVSELETIRDNNLVDFLKVLRRNDWGAGKTLKNPADMISQQPDQMDASAVPLITWQGVVHEDWADYNNHMTEFRYLEVFSMATDKLLFGCGAGPVYVKQGFSFYTVETHIRHIDEIATGEPIYVETRLINHDAKKVHLYHDMYGGKDKRHLASGEHMLLHVDMNAGRAAPMPDHLAQAFAQIADAQSELPQPDAAGAAIGMKRK
ncbi:MAG: carnitine 3-dehydrogenase [Candidatus Puniceispirillum sp. TMED52]|nr:carnitine 3-dehydrogenase [SAR116 cluster bacterium]OUU52580.1 MAG: carnitine 3-dehydrogenase [Candidatus Puniceispirillum sp. TMED52]